jgi:hypothetical protein
LSMMGAAPAAPRPADKTSFATTRQRLHVALHLAILPLALWLVWPLKSGRASAPHSVQAKRCSISTMEVGRASGRNVTFLP